MLKDLFRLGFTLFSDKNVVKTCNINTDVTESFKEKVIKLTAQTSVFIASRSKQVKPIRLGSFDMMCLD